MRCEALADLVRAAAAKGRHWSEAFPDSVGKDDLPWKVIADFDADIRGHVERDRRIEDERDRVLIAAVNLAESEFDDRDEVRRSLLAAVRDLERTVLRFGIVNRQAAKLGYGLAGDPVSAERNDRIGAASGQR